MDTNLGALSYLAIYCSCKDQNTCADTFVINCQPRMFPSENPADRHCGSNAAAAAINFIPHTVGVGPVRDVALVAFAAMVAIEKSGYALDRFGVYFAIDVYIETNCVATARDAAGNSCGSSGFMRSLLRRLLGLAPVLTRRRGL
jgi:hypothetical protein